MKTMKTMFWLTLMLVIMHSMCIKGQSHWTRITMYVPKKERTETIPNLSPAECMEQCQLHRWCKAVGMDEDDHEEDRVTTCFLLSRKPSEKDKEKEGSSMNLSVMYEDEDYSSYTMDFYYVNIEGSYPVHGSWGKWGQFTQCNTTCGMGYQVRERKCDDPIPSNGGFNCSGISQEYKKCKVKECPPVDGGYGSWSTYSKCSKSCGPGQQTRTRLCDSPSPKHGGKNCDALGPSSETQSCNTCPVHGGYGEWSSYGPCSKTCGAPGTQTRTRNCDMPSPAYGGKDCTGLGESTETKSCNTNNTKPCPALNRAWNKPSYQPITRAGLIASRGNDGDTRTYSSTNQYWYVDLEEDFSINKVVVHTSRTKTSINVYVGSSSTSWALCERFINPKKQTIFSKELAIFSGPCNINNKGRYVKIEMKKPCFIYEAEIYGQPI